MARNSNNAATDTSEVDTTKPVDSNAAESNTPAAAAAADERFKMVTDPDTHQQVKRGDYIRKCWVEKKMSRGQIAKHLSEITGKPVKYQVVFATIKKGTPGGPDPVAATPAPAAAAATEGAAS